MAIWVKRQVVILSIIFIGGLIVRFFYDAYNEVVDTYQDQLTHTAFGIELYLTARHNALQVLAADPDILAGEVDLHQPKYLHFQQTFKLHDISIYTVDGKCIASTDPSLIGSTANSREFMLARQGQRIISDRLARNNFNFINVYTPISVGNNIKGVLAIGIPSYELAKILSMSSANEYFFIVDGNGNFLFHPYHDTIPRLQTMTARLLENFFKAPSGQLTSNINPDQIRKLYIFTNIPHTDWRLVLGVPLTHLYSRILKDIAGDIAALLIIMFCFNRLYQLWRRTQQYQRGVELMQLERLSALNQLSAGIAHEIRNPLTSIKGFIQLMASKKAPPSRHHIDIILEEIGRIEQLINEFRQMAKPLPDTLLHSRVDLAATIDDIKVLMDGLALNHNVTIVFNRSGPCMVECNSAQLKQVWLNLLRNAIEAMPDGGTITINLKTEGDKAVVTIDDTGMGIPPEVLPRLGTPFFTTKIGGTGLGLSVCYDIIHQHNGQIEIDSRPGEGTTITVTLPLVQIDSQQKP